MFPGDGGRRSGAGAGQRRLAAAQPLRPLSSRVRVPAHDLGSSLRRLCRTRGRRLLL